MEQVDPKEGSNDHQAESNNIGEVFPNLWIGSLSSVPKIASLKGKSDTDETSPVRWTVVTVVSDALLIRLSETMIEKLPACVHVKHIVWRLEDDPAANFLSCDLLRVMDEIDSCCMSTSKSAKHGCLLHCAKGISRSAAVCAAWLMSRQGLSLMNAMDTIRRVRPQTQPNLGFCAALRAIEQCSGDVVAARARFDSMRLLT